MKPGPTAHRPAPVGEMPLDASDDVRRRVGGQLDAAVDVESVDRLDQPNRPDLDEVVELLAAIGVSSRERTHERHVPLDQLFACLQIAVLVVAAQQNLVGLVQPSPPFTVSSRFVNSTHCEPSRSSIWTESQTTPR